MNNINIVDIFIIPFPFLLFDRNFCNTNIILKVTYNHDTTLIQPFRYLLQLYNLSSPLYESERTLKKIGREIRGM